jgi:NADH kinase
MDQISDIARAPAELSVDGREVCMLKSGESVIIKKSPFPIPCVVRGEGGGGWARDIK